MHAFRIAVCGLAAAGAMVVGDVPQAAAQEQSAKTDRAAAGGMTIDAARGELAARARPDGWWETSNEAYMEEGAPESFAMRFEGVPGGLANTGCLWGVRDGEIEGPYWYFYAAWDPGESAILIYQSSPGGAVAIGHQTDATGDRETVQTLHRPGQEPLWIRHTSEHPDADTLIDRSFTRVDGAWEPSRKYTWHWTPAQGREPPC